MMRLRVLVQTVLAVTLLAIAATPTAEAQKGLGKGRNRPPPAPSEQTTSKEQQPSQENQPSKEELAPGEYSFEGIQVLEAINRGEGRRALAYYERAAVQAEQQGNQLRAARALGAATTAAVRLGRYQKAIQSGTRSIELFKTAAEPARPDLMAWVMVHAQLAAAYRVVGDLTRARQVLEEGLEVAKTRLSGRREGQVEGYLLNGLARVSYLQQDYQTALAASREAVRYVEDLRADLGDSELRSGYFEEKQAIYRQAVYLALQAQHPDEAFALAERSRSRTFLDLLGSQTTLSKGRTRALVDEEVRLRARLAEAQAQAQDAGGMEESDRARAQVDALDRDYRAFLERVRKESLEQASLMVVEPVTLPEIQALLPEGTTLLEYFVGEGGVILWVVDRQHAKAVRLPGDRQSLLGQVRRLREAITGQAPVADVQAQGQALYRRLLEPARGEIRGSRIVVVPHGALHYLPFAALRSPAGRWVVQDLAVSTLPSASVLRYVADKGAGASTRALVVGNPDLGAELALPWAEREARMVGQLEQGATVLVRADATEAQVKKLLETAGVVHLATHGELSESDPLSSTILLVPGGGEDGRLEVREVFGLDLHARLVVLSACETGLGKLSRGDELVGLQRAFLYAGTPAVVTTLWKVDDRATFELVRAFYTRLESAGSVDALRQAQLETMRAFPHPYAWAAYGDLPAVANLLLKQGCSPEEASKLMGRN